LPLIGLIAGVEKIADMVWIREVVLGTSLAEFNPEKVPLFVAKLFRGK
jgi:hypothetical protein